MAFNRKYFTRNDMLPADMFQSATYDATQGDSDLTTDRIAQVEDVAGAGFFPPEVVPKGGLIVAVKMGGAAADGEPAVVKMYVVNRVTLNPAVNGVTLTTRATAMNAEAADAAGTAFSEDAN